MKQNVLDQAEKYARAHRRRNRWHKVTTVMASVVVFGTTYALILPAITAERTTCGIVEHTHNDSCYREIPAVTRQELVCSEESLNIHEHTKACYDDENSLTCGYADFVVHKHDESCYDESGNLVCTLPEIEAHTHDESCYAQPASAVHVHTEACYSLQPVFLVCAETEGEGHVHTADCYTETTYLSCMFSDVEGHEHGPECYETVTELTCGQTEGGGHQHGEDCYVWDEVLTCEYADVTPEEPELICNKEEIVLHKHTKDCYDEDGNLICGMLEVLEHKHTEDCFQTVVVSEATRELICEKQEHVHDSSCYPETEKITEKQTEEMTETAAETQTEKLTEAETEAQTEELAEAESESETEESTELVTEAETEDESEELTEVESESESEEESETETEEADVLDEEFRLTAQAESGIEVTVSGPVTSLPYPVEEISLTVEEVTDEEVLAIWKQTVEEEGLDDQKAFLLDITLWHDEEEIEPIGPVQVTFVGVEIPVDNPSVYHIDTEIESAEDMNAVVDEDGTVFLNTDHFSIYVVTAPTSHTWKAGDILYLDVRDFTAAETSDNDFALYYTKSSGGTSRVLFKASTVDHVYKVELPNDMNVGSEINFIRVKKNDIDVAYNWIDGGATLQTDKNAFKATGWGSGTDKWCGEWADGWYTESMAGQTMTFENKSGTALTGVKAYFYTNTNGTAVSTVNIGNVADGAYSEFTIPETYGAYIQFVDENETILGDNFSNFMGEGSGESGVENFTYNAKTKYCYKYKNDATDSTWGVPGDGTAIYNSSSKGKQLNALADGGVYYLAEDVNWNSTVNISEDTTLNLNGHKITTSANPLFNVKSGVTLTIIDTVEPTDTKTSASGNKYGRQGSLSSNVLTYYVTESVANGTATSETVYKHTVDFGSCGSIVCSGTGDNVIKVEGGTLNIEGGRISSNGSHVLVLDTSSGGTINISGGLIQGKNGGEDGAGIYIGKGNLNVSGGYIAGGSSGKGGGIYMNAGTINLTDKAVIAANKATNNGGGVYVNSGTLNISGGTVASNWVDEGNGNNGGGIFINSGTISMTDGYVTNNSKYGGANDGNGNSGGGGIAMATSSKMYMSGGYITGNYSKEAGGGVYAGFWQSGDSGCRFIMSGGTIASNYADGGEGGGLRVGGGAQAQISASSSNEIYITNNETHTTIDWGGGGIFVQTDGLLNILDVLITNNHAEGFGGGVGACPTGGIDGVANKGSAIFDNTAKCVNVRQNTEVKIYDVKYKNDYTSQKAFRTPYNGGAEPYDAQDYFTTGDVSTMVNQQEMIGGGSENWNSSGQSAGTVYDFKVEGASVWALTANPKNGTDGSDARAAATAAASVFVTGNWSNTHGGGIMTNGGLDMGKTTKTEVKTSLTMKATKQVQLTDGSMKTSGLEGFSFVLLNKKPTWDTENKHWTYSDSDIVKVNDVAQKKTNTSAGVITFDKITYDIAGYYSYYMVETPITGVSGSYEQDPTLYTVGVMVTSTTATSDTTKTTTYSIEKVELKAQVNGVVKGTKEISLTDGSDKTIDITSLTDGKTFTNKETIFYALPETGGAGTTLYTLGGLLLMAVAEFFLLYNYKKRRKEDGASS